MVIDNIDFFIGLSDNRMRDQILSLCVARNELGKKTYQSTYLNIELIGGNYEEGVRMDLKFR